MPFTPIDPKWIVEVVGLFMTCAALYYTGGGRRIGPILGVLGGIPFVALGFMTQSYIFVLTSVLISCFRAYNLFRGRSIIRDQKEAKGP